MGSDFYAFVAWGIPPKELFLSKEDATRIMEGDPEFQSRESLESLLEVAVAAQDYMQAAAFQAEIKKAKPSKEFSLPKNWHALALETMVSGIREEEDFDFVSYDEVDYLALTGEGFSEEFVLEVDKLSESKEVRELKAEWAKVVLLAKKLYNVTLPPGKLLFLGYYG